MVMFRKAKEEDRARIEALFLEMLRTIYNTDDVQEYDENALDRYFTGGEDRLIVAEEDGEVVAYLTTEVHREDGYIYLDDLSVTADYRGYGIGSYLIHDAEAYAGEVGINVIVFHVESSNTRAHSLYKRLGYIDDEVQGTRIRMVKLGLADPSVHRFQLINDDYLGHVDVLRHASRGVLVRDGKVLLGYETKYNKYIIPGGGVEGNESFAEGCEREMLEETGLKVKAAREYVVIDELFDVWQHINHYFVCELIEDTGEVHLTEAEDSAGVTSRWVPLDEAIKIFGRYEDYHKTNIADYGLYRREHLALVEYKKGIENDQNR